VVVETGVALSFQTGVALSFQTGVTLSFLVEAWARVTRCFPAGQGLNGGQHPGGGMAGGMRQGMQQMVGGYDGQGQGGGAFDPSDFPVLGGRGGGGPGAGQIGHLQGTTLPA